MHLKSLKLTNFRQFHNQKFKFTKPWTIIVGPNARGKSSIVESIFILSTGQSPWTSESADLIYTEDLTEPLSNRKTGPRTHLQTDKPLYKTIAENTCRIEAEIETSEDKLPKTTEVKTLTLFLQNNSGSLTKQYKIDDQPTIRNKFTQNIHTILFSPNLIDDLMYEPRQRRDFLDVYISQMNPEYSDQLQNYNKILRHRNSLLKTLSGKKYSFRVSNNGGITSEDQTNLKFWTDQLLDSGTQIMEQRMAFILKLNTTERTQYPTQINYIPKVKVGGMEDMIARADLHNFFRQQLDSSSDKELIIGQTVVGPHRDDWHLASKDKDLNEFGSRGEKRMGIVDILLKINVLMQDINSPILLLDDISSELDENNVGILFKEKVNPKQQVIITTTHLNSIPEAAREKANVIELGAN